MKYVYNTLIGIVLLVAGVALIAFFLPSEIRVIRSIEIEAPAEHVFPLIENLNRWPEWTAWSQRDPSMKLTQTGPQNGVGATQSWASETEGNGSLSVIVSESPHYMAYDLRIEGFDSLSVGEFELEESAAGTTVIWIDNIDFGGNLIGRIFGLFLDGMIGNDFEVGLQNLKSRAEESL
ncbi:MAG: SRPBCC family protein [Pseudomonadota bacterium]